MPLRLVTWNVNSVRLRGDSVARLVAEKAPDVLCLQEIKVADELFPADMFNEHGYVHQAVYGQKAYHGVAILSRVPLEKPQRHEWWGKEDSRHLHVRLPGGIGLHNFYVPAGGDVPDPDENPKFAHKLGFLDEITEWFAGGGHPAKDILVGDLNIAPLETDVWSHKQLLKIVSHTPVEVEALDKLAKSRKWVDAVRHIIPREELLYSWWSYRAKDWSAADKGRRLDHVWVTPKLRSAIVSAEVVRPARGWDKPSDHAPVIVDLDI
jgi:exodeoxyribonuclease-3